MKNSFVIKLFFVLSFTAVTTCANTGDSLRREILSAKHDSTRCLLLAAYGEYLFNGNPDSALLIWKQAKSISEKKLDAKNLSDEERKFFMRSFSVVLHNIGYVKMQKGDIGSALKDFDQSLIIRERLGDKKEIAAILNSIGMVHHSQSELEKALEYFLRSMKLLEEINDEAGIAGALNNIAYIYDNQGKYDKAMECYNRSLAIRKTAGEENGVAYCLNNLGYLYNKTGNVSKAVECFNECVKIREKTGDKKGMAKVLNNIAGIYIARNDYSKALAYASRSLEIGKKLGYPELIRGAAKYLSIIYKAKGDFKRSFENYELYIVMRDSIVNVENRNAAIKNQMEYEYGKKMSADSVAHAKKSEIVAAQLSRQRAELKAKRNQQYVLFGGILVVLVFGGVMFNRFRVAEKQKQIIEMQKNLVEMKQSEILDSIHYARRIQSALLTSERYIGRHISRLKSNKLR